MNRDAHLSRTHRSLSLAQISYFIWLVALEYQLWMDKCWVLFNLSPLDQMAAILANDSFK